MSIRLLLNQLKESDIRLQVKDSKLKVNAPQGKLTPDLVEKIKNRKQEIIDFLQKTVQSQAEYTAIEPMEKKEYYATSSAQKRIYFLQQLDVESSVYNILNVIPLPGQTRPEELETTFKKLIRRHESLRTSFEMMQEKLVQKIHREVDFKIRCYNRIDDFVRSFDLAQAPLLRAGVIDSGDQGRLLVVDMHHITADGISERILRRDFIALDRGEYLSPLRLQYKDYAQWNNRSVHREAYKKQEAYWLEMFPGEIPVLELPTDYPRPPLHSYEGSRIFFQLPGEQTALLKQMALKKESTLYMLLLTLFTILLSKLSGQEDIVIGTPTAGRSHADLENIIGMFVNTLAIRNYPAGEKTVDVFWHEVSQRVLTAFQNQEYLFEDLVENVVLNRETVRNPLFDVMFVLQNLGEYSDQEPTSVKNSEEPAKEDEYKNNVSRFDMSWSAVEVNNCLVFNIEYCTKLFAETTIHRFVHYFKRIVTAVIATPGKPIAEIEILSENERKKILIDFNQSKTVYPQDKTVHQLFAEQAEQAPDQIAVIRDRQGNEAVGGNGGHAVTYNELNQRAGQLAIVLREKGIESGSIAGIMIERSIPLIAAMVAVLKCGGAYLPLDPKLPLERIKYMQADSNAQVLVTTRLLAEEGERVKQWDGEKIFLESGYCPGKGEVSSPAANQDALLPTLFASTPSTRRDRPTNLAYVIYTSGSTGRPKGVMIEHGNIVRLVINSNFIRWTREDRLLPTGGAAFDISTFEIWGTLLNGAVLILADDDALLNAEKLKKMISENKISILHLVPQIFNQLARQSYTIYLGLKYFLVGGDRVAANHVNELMRRFYKLKIIHMYGPTENTTFSTYLPVTEFFKTTIPIGRPVANSTVFIIDKYNQLVPTGVPGELVVGGAGVARGYLNRPELTAQKFLRISSLFNRSYRPYMSYISYRANIYKTGDLAKWQPDGNIEFLGRIDTQVKIRGQRIELGEIENQLLKHEHIKEAVVIAAENRGDKFLCAYVVTDQQLEIPGLKRYLSRFLPDYMIPTHFMPMEDFPLTQTGKIDRNSLPAPVIKANRAYEPPGDSREELLCKIWSQVLGIEKEKIGINDNFFDIGGNSLNLIMLVGLINKELGLEIPIPQIYRYPTIRDITRDITSMHYSDQYVVLLNESRPAKIFCFPDQLGWGYGYGSLATLLNDYSVYGLVFIEEEDRLSRYIEIIKDIQPHGPYVFLGHSAAGRLSLEVTKALEDQGSEVSDIIFLDCFILELDLNREEERRKHTRFLVEEFLSERNAEFLIEKVLEKAINHMLYLQTEDKLEKVNANIHLIVSQQNQQQDELRGWENLTTKTYRVYNGWGRHVDMLSGPDLKKNLTIINQILAGITFGNEAMSN